MAIISGKLVSQKMLDNLKTDVLILVGDNPASKIYVNNKKKDCAEIGIYSEEHLLPESTSQSELLQLISKLNQDKKINGILAQLPMPKHIDERIIAEAISPDKDIDVFNSSNVGKLLFGDATLLPCTPAGIIELLKHENIQIEGKNCVIVGRSNIVGKPLALLLLKENATVTICHSKTENIKSICKSADILICAVGKAKFITKDMVKLGAVVVDVGINKDANGKLCGDVDFENVNQIASYITPVPGGVGPMTISILMKNTITAAKLQNDY